MTTRRLFVFTAVHQEARAVRRAMPDGDVVVHTIGIAATRLAGAPPVRPGDVVLLAGVAGALDPSLAIGDVVLDDPAGLLPAAFAARRGTVHTADAIVATPAGKAALFRRTRAAVVDMEQQVVRAWAEERGAVVIGLRAVSDTAAQTLDPAVVRFVNDVGRPRPLVIAATLLRRPALVAYLRRLGADTNLAVVQLGLAVRDVVEALRAAAD